MHSIWALEGSKVLGVKFKIIASVDTKIHAEQGYVSVLQNTKNVEKVSPNETFKLS
jgi:hypothetical protein